MKNITLISDWKLRDPYVAMFKGEILTAFPEVNILDLTHSITLHHIPQTAFILRNSYLSFPNGTVHLILTGLSFSKDSLPVIAQYNGHWFIGEDTGIFSLLFDGDENFTCRQYPKKNKKSLNQKIIEMVGWLFGQTIEKETVPYPKIVPKTAYKPSYSKLSDTITGKIVFIDGAANAITNIPVSLFHEARKNRNFNLKIASRTQLITSAYYDHYKETDESIYLVPNRLGYIEISIYHGNIAALASIHVDDQVEIIFD